MFQLRKYVILNILSASKAFEIIEDDSEISGVVVANVSFSQVQDGMATLFIITEQQQSNVSELRTKLLSLEKSITISYAQKPHQTKTDSYFGH